MSVIGDKHFIHQPFISVNLHSPTCSCCAQTNCFSLQHTNATFIIRHTKQKNTMAAATSEAPLKTPIAAPTPDSKPVPRPELTPEQQTKYEALLEKAKAFTEIKCDKEKDKSGPLTDRELAWLTRDCLLRYLRATKWSVDDAAKRLLSTLAWRREYGIDEFTPDYISPEQETGKQIIMGFDRQGRPCQYLNPGRQNTDSSPRQIHHLFYMVERVVDMMPPGVEMLSLMINFKPSKQRQNTSVPVSTAREVLHILQNHYPERLGKALIINGKFCVPTLLTPLLFIIVKPSIPWRKPKYENDKRHPTNTTSCSTVPWLVQGFFKIITPFIDPVTREKLKFNEDMKQYVPAEQLWSSDWNGDLDFEYDHETYWPALNDLCKQKREQKLTRWAAAGKAIGESEEYLTGGTDLSVTGFKYTANDKDILEKEQQVDAETSVLAEKLAGANLEEETVQAQA